MRFFCGLQTTLISVDSLSKVIAASQLTPEFGGTLVYDNHKWIQMRMVQYYYSGYVLLFHGGVAIAQW